MVGIEQYSGYDKLAEGIEVRFDAVDT